MIEIGPGKVLCGLMRQIDRSITCLNVGDDASLNKAREHLDRRFSLTYFEPQRLRSFFYLQASGLLKTSLTQWNSKSQGGELIVLSDLSTYSCACCARPFTTRRPPLRFLLPGNCFRHKS